MFVTPAFAQSGGLAGGPDILMSILPFALIFVIMYFLIIRPQRQQMKKREEMLKAVRRGDTVVTGGGIVGNTRRVLPGGLTLKIDWTSWHRPAIFTLLQRRGGVPEADMRRTFNLGIGYCVILAQRSVPAALEILYDLGERPVVIGEVVRQRRARRSPSRSGRNRLAANPPAPNGVQAARQPVPEVPASVSRPRCTSQPF